MRDVHKRPSPGTRIEIPTRGGLGDHLLCCLLVMFGAMEFNTFSLQTNIKTLKRASSPRLAHGVKSTYRAPVAVRLLVPGEPGRTQKHRLNSGPLIDYRVILAVDSGTLEGGANPRNGEAEPILLTT